MFSYFIERVIPGRRKANGNLWSCSFASKIGRSKWAGTRPWILLVEYSCCGVALFDDLVGFQARPVTWDYEL
jgi:hypothetical protein